jgi:hypothetical protein
MAYTDREDLNYLGQLFLIGANQTPFLNMMGGLARGAETVKSFSYPIAQPWSLNAAAQLTQSEATAAAAGTATTYTRAQDLNYIQIMKHDYAVTNAKQSTSDEISGVSLARADQPVRDELAFQRFGALRQLAINLEYSYLKGVGAASATSATNGKMDGLKSVIATNTVAAGGDDLTKADIDALIKEMADNGAIFENMVLFCNSYNKQIITDAYAYAPTDRNVGGVNIKQIETDFTMLGVQYAPQMPADEVYIVDMSVCKPVFCPWEGKVIADVPTAVVAAQKGGYIYTQAGFNYGPEEYHGSITGTATV